METGDFPWRAISGTQPVGDQFKKDVPVLLGAISLRAVVGRLELKLETHPRYLGLDVGNRRIGVAVSDELGLTAQPVLTLERRHNQRDDLRSLARLCRRFAVVGIVVGNPLHMSGEVSPQAAKTRTFADELGKLTGLPIHLWDERLTTHEAHQILYEAGHARQEHRKVVDQVAATLILRSFMERQGMKYREQGTGNGEQGPETRD